MYDAMCGMLLNNSMPLRLCSICRAERYSHALDDGKLKSGNYHQFGGAVPTLGLSEI